MSSSRFFIDKPIVHEGVKLLYISKSKYGADWSSSLHSHFYTELFFVKSGRGWFRVEEDTFAIAENSLVLINPNVEHTELSTAAGAMEYIVLGLEGVGFLFPDAEADPKNRCRILDCTRQREEYLFCLETILKELEDKLPQYELVCQNTLETFLVRLTRQFSMRLHPVSGRRSSKECAQVKRYIDENYRQPLTLDDLAREAHINKYHLVHAFTDENGISPINYLIRRRIDESKYFLENTDYTIAQISQYTGFTSPSYFSQVFKRTEGISPNQYRAHCRQAGAVQGAQR